MHTLMTRGRSCVGSPRADTAYLGVPNARPELVEDEPHGRLLGAVIVCVVRALPAQRLDAKAVRARPEVVPDPVGIACRPAAAAAAAAQRDMHSPIASRGTTPTRGRPQHYARRRGRARVVRRVLPREVGRALHTKNAYPHPRTHTKNADPHPRTHSRNAYSHSAGVHGGGGGGGGSGGSGGGGSVSGGGGSGSGGSARTHLRGQSACDDAREPRDCLRRAPQPAAARVQPERRGVLDNEHVAPGGEASACMRRGPRHRCVPPRGGGGAPARGGERSKEPQARPSYGKRICPMRAHTGTQITNPPAAMTPHAPPASSMSSNAPGASLGSPAPAAPSFSAARPHSPWGSPIARSCAMCAARNVRSGRGVARRSNSSTPRPSAEASGPNAASSALSSAGGRSASAGHECPAARYLRIGVRIRPIMDGPYVEYISAHWGTHTPNN